jgi:predicted Zn-dependent protease
MAHEIAHVACRHGTRQATKGDIAQIATIPLIFMGGWTGYALYQAAGVAIPLGFLTFSRAFESEADMLGLEYMYKTGYDPTAFVDFFEKIETLEKRKPGTMSKVFSTHPLTADRITAAQKNIATILKAKPEYVLNTSEFNDVRERLAMLHNRRRIDIKNDDASRPTLRRNPGSGTVDDESGDTKAPEDQDERPTLKRRDN